MLSRFFRRRTIWWPTWPGWLIFLALLGCLTAAWCYRAEPLLALTERQPADVLVVEGWIGLDGMHAAKEEFIQGGYRYVVTAGALTSNRWNTQRWNYAMESGKLLIRAGISPDQVITAPALETEGQRTFEAALAVRRELEARGLHPTAVNVFTLGAHARRSRLIYAKALPTGIAVGCIAWVPAVYGTEPWWKSSDRAADLIKETVGYAFELLLNSGRTSNSPHAARP